jgi:UDP-N-acetylmuramoyl-tripeptide--D-alanyl-D-alanine ligase
MSDRPLWTVDEMTRAIGAQPEGALPGAVHGISIDTRTIKPGEAFFAIRGENRDGHDFVSSACARGAALAVVAEHKRASLPHAAPLLLVPDVLDALRDLAREARARSRARVLAVTGSVGKTGTKDALRLVLAGQGETHVSAASYNNHWGVPLSLARMPPTAKFAVFEIGMNHAGEITPLVRLARPHVAMITAVAPVHLAYFGSVEAIADAKAEVFLGVEPGGSAVINRDNMFYERLARAARRAGVANVVSFGEHSDADARLLDMALKPDCSMVRASVFGSQVVYRIGAPGRHIALNSIAVLAAATLVGADLAIAALALNSIEPPSGRGKRIALETPTGTALLIDESYNANPASMRAALEVLGAAPLGKSGRRIAVLGDMLELGDGAAEFHRGLGEAVVVNAVDLVFCAGPLMAELWSQLPAERRGGLADTAALLEPKVVSALRGGDAIMVKGSLGSRMGSIVRALEHRFSSPDAAEYAAAQG